MSVRFISSISTQFSPVHLCVAVKVLGPCLSLLCSTTHPTHTHTHNTSLHIPCSLLQLTPLQTHTHTQYASNFATVPTVVMRFVKKQTNKKLPDTTLAAKSPRLAAT